MKIQLEFNDTQNFTGRVRIKQKNELFSLQLLDRQDETIRIHVKFDRAAIEKECKLRADEPKEFVLDVFVLGDIHRHVLPEYRSDQNVAGPLEGATASIAAKNSSRRFCFFFIASRRPGKAGCFGTETTPLRVPQVCQITPKVRGWSDAPKVVAQHFQ